MAKFYRIKPDVAQVVQYNGTNANEVFDLIGEQSGFYNKSNGLWMYRNYGQTKVDVNDYIVRTSLGDVKVYDPVEFNKMYEALP